jgi:ATP/ADP translocase
MVTAGGAEVLPFLASCCVLPASVAFFVLYGKLVSGAEAQSARAAAAAAALAAAAAATHNCYTLSCTASW